MTIGDSKNSIRVLLYSYYTTITGWGVFLNHTLKGNAYEALNPKPYYRAEIASQELLSRRDIILNDSLL